MSKMLSCEHNYFHVLWKLYFINACVIGKLRESLIIHPISDLVTHCRWLWVVGDVVVVCMIKR